eukprot:CAMPEP_0172740680 /NCGR_PEP_ID=MMETSP1074-20121228/125382_1 /TAXON_ID=2916 /ORGANISM="Ceratium fusus, Strain PA161109" /LENGTH=79 /DNA_ID=CAMNT_0013570847 /DNA_START=204 /DNA_END=444 /DNA_ORIENTATION=+
MQQSSIRMADLAEAAAATGSSGLASGWHSLAKRRYPALIFSCPEPRATPSTAYRSSFSWFSSEPALSPAALEEDEDEEA